MADESTAGSAGKGSSLPVADPTGPLRVALRGITSVVAPTSVVTAMLFYFGWTRTATQADALGLHDSLLGYSSQDYLLRSIDPMFWPLVVGVVTTVAALALHMWLVGWAGREPTAVARRRLRVLSVAGGALGLVALAAGTAGSRVTEPSRLVFLASPLLVTGGIVAAGYALYVRGRFLRRRQRAPAAPEVGQLRLISSSLLVLLLLLSVFWSVQRYAYVKGVDLAVQLVDDLDYRPDVVVYSAKRLQLQPPVAETDLGGDSAAYRFRYTGLKLLFRSSGRYFLRPSDPREAVNIVIAESPDLRFEFIEARP